MSRLILLLVIAAAIYLLLRSYSRKNEVREKETVEDMVRCAHCGVHLPRSEGIQSDGKFYCSTEHRDAARR